jgi:histidine triad (HIT) family protein
LKLPERDPCPLCEVVASGTWTLDGERVQAVVVGRNDAALAFLKDDRTDGYAFVIPKRHAATLLDLESAEAHAVIDLIIDVSRAMDAELSLDGINVLQNNGIAAGQTVPHAHFHVIPRSHDDEWLPPAGQRWTGRRHRFATVSMSSNASVLGCVESPEPSGCGRLGKRPLVHASAWETGP